MRTTAVMAGLMLLAGAIAALATDLEDARLIKNVYDEAPAGDGWRAIPVGELNGKGVDTDLMKRGDRWRGEVYERKNDIVLAWAGNLGGDEGLVVAQEIGIPMPEFVQAAEVARQVVKAYPDRNVSFAGHSMGGAFAAAAAYATGKDAVLFNAQGLHPDTVAAINGPGPGKMRHYHVAFEYATMVQSLIPFFPRAQGLQIPLPNLGWDPMFAHNIEQVIAAMEAQSIP